MSENTTISISLSEYHRLMDESRFLSCLEACGVDNWTGWDDAINMYNEEEE